MKVLAKDGSFVLYFHELFCLFLLGTKTQSNTAECLMIIPHSQLVNSRNMQTKNGDEYSLTSTQPQSLLTINTLKLPKCKSNACFYSPKTSICYYFLCNISN